ncbi:glutaredoxin family protein [Desulforamulus ruminis]|uniref:Glutaredoxin n=1 Tax=Desulforamulus ruminis (strain ATCC 23193 / DSM 2154 / NCIMB 8452 / DL) TaxID=696281 RepID=F6DR97_DESRL|nr:glutaredoxin domain-containing protein [Desulforamulus ruminis]AEG60932.1 glutaredoxin [Desulforamulus ruminis DSM 2154]
MADYHVTLFVSPWKQSECDQARKYLKEKNLHFEEKNIQDSGAKGELLQKTGRDECPAIDVNGHLVIGYLPHKWDHLLSQEPLELT